MFVVCVVSITPNTDQNHLDILLLMSNVPLSDRHVLQQTEVSLTQKASEEKYIHKYIQIK